MSSSAKAYRVLSCLKIMLIIFTVFLLCTGVLFLASGIYGLMALKHYVDLSAEVNISMTPAVLCGIGGLVIVSGLFGFLTAVKNNKCMVNCYCILIGIVFLIEIAGGITAIVFMNQIESSFKTGIEKALMDYNPSVENPIDKAQLELGCCGGISFNDWFDSPWATNVRQCGPGLQNGTTVPYSCCRPGTGKDLDDPRKHQWDQDVCFCGDNLDVTNVNSEGCLDILFGKSGQTLRYLLIAAFGMAATQLAGILISVCIYRKLREISIARRHY
ncbi:unnamed protein product [Clavelina lepadiformis]|uniref:Tetraspanin n=1 Tax=Clavelina lepadiformis TaxID=159417 RepID=A0ABP0GQR2_CLALP